MALVQINYNAPHFTALSTDIVDNKIHGLSYVGTIVHLIDTNEKKIVNEDLTLSDYIIINAVKSDDINKIVVVTQAEYDLIDPKIPTTLYFVTT
jgi:hypothetical protein